MGEHSRLLEFETVQTAPILKLVLNLVLFFTTRVRILIGPPAFGQDRLSNIADIFSLRGKTLSYPLECSNQRINQLKALLYCAWGAHIQNTYKWEAHTTVHSTVHIQDTRYMLSSIFFLYATVYYVEVYVSYKKG